MTVGWGGAGEGRIVGERGGIKDGGRKDQRNETKRNERNQETHLRTNKRNPEILPPRRLILSLSLCLGRRSRALRRPWNRALLQRRSVHVNFWCLLLLVGELVVMELLLLRAGADLIFELDGRGTHDWWRDIVRIRDWSGARDGG